MRERCANMNHSRSNAPIKFCPTCGEIVNRLAQGRCDKITHMALRKDRHAFCTTCGEKLSANP